LTDPLTQIVSLLQPNVAFTKLAEAAGIWRVRRSEQGQPFYCAILDGSCRLAVGSATPMILEAGDFVLVPSVFEFAMLSIEPMPAGRSDTVPIVLNPGHVRLGRQEGLPDVRTLIGYCSFGSPDASLLVSLLPEVIRVRDEERLTKLVQFVNEESLANRPGRDVVLARLVEVLLIEALRSTASTRALPGLLRGLADERLASALRQMHEQPTRPWTVSELARAAALSRSSFFERFRQAVGLSPMDYLIHWRMVLAKDLLRHGKGSVAEVAREVGYGSSSSFSIAFTRHVGMPPSAYARDQAIG
jgi:AraC-like DNA-binding protein